jgi:aerobic-type carbon monoxide dehydrogenase small subunit (CoxS/CutS family)
MLLTLEQSLVSLTKLIRVRKMLIDFKVNGKSYHLDVCPTMRLLDLLRDELGLIGTKEGCGEGECGSCTVIMDGKAVSSCLVLAPQINGKEIITVEGLAGDRELDLLQQKFIEHSAVECGFCTPGMLMSAKGTRILGSNH